MSEIHVLICGYGAAGAAVAKAFQDRGLPTRCIAVIERCAAKADLAREAGHQSVCGDARNQNRLRVAQAGAAQEIVICVDDTSAPTVARSLRTVSPGAFIKVLAQEAAAAEPTRAAGADLVLVLSDLAGQLLAESAFLSLPETKSG